LHVHELCGVEIDPACKDPARISFVSADRNARLNLEATPITPLPEEPKAKARATDNEQARRRGKPSKEEIRDMLRFIPKRPDYPDWIKVVAAVGDALSEADAVEMLNEWSPEESRDEYAAKLKHRLKDVHIGTLFQLAREHGWIPRYEIRGQSLVDYSQEEIDESQNVLAYRWLERRHGATVTGPSGIGKSTAVYQASVCWAAGLVAFGIRPAGALRIVTIQTEDSHNDLIEMSRCIHRLGLTELQLELVRENAHIETINDAVGLKFIEKLDSFLGQKPRDLVILNPLSDFIEGELTDEAKVKLFLRQLLNPLLAKHHCGVLCVQPTPKTNREDTEKYSWFDWMYWGAGSAEFARWARGGIVIVPNKEARGVYRFIAAKRFEKLGWLEPTYWFAHSVEHDVGLWVPATEEQIALCQKAKDKKPEDLHAVFPSEKELLRDDVRLLGKERLGLGYHTTDGFLTILVSHDWIYLREYPRPKKRPEVRFLKNENPSQELR
jgi:AAA domain/Primase C terminal 2 (PriCT-2)